MLRRAIWTLTKSTIPQYKFMQFNPYRSFTTENDAKPDNKNDELKQVMTEKIKQVIYKNTLVDRDP